MSPFVSTRLLLTQSDARLVKLAGEGHERAFEALVHRYRRPLLAYCRRLLLPDERAEDALQQGLLQAWLALQSGAEVRDARPWLYRIVHNTALNMLRVSGYDYAKLAETLQGTIAPEDDLDRRIAVRDAFAGLAALPAMQREALLRTAVDGYSHEHAAQAMGLTEGALRGLVYRARATLRAATTALMPPPAVSWALSHRGLASAPLTDRLAELGAGGGSVGIGGLLVKGGAVVVTAGALAGGVAVTHRHTAKVAQSLTVAPADAAASPGAGSSASADGVPTALHRDAYGRNDNHGKRSRPGGNGPRRVSPRTERHLAAGRHDVFGKRGDGRGQDRGGDPGQGQPSDPKSGSGDHEGLRSASKGGSGSGSILGFKDDTGSSSTGAKDGIGSGGSASGSKDGPGPNDGSGSESNDGAGSGSSGGETNTSGTGDGSKSGDSQLEGSPTGPLFEPSAGNDGSPTIGQVDG